MDFASFGNLRYVAEMRLSSTSLFEVNFLLAPFSLVKPSPCRFPMQLAVDGPSQ